MKKLVALGVMVAGLACWALAAQACGGANCMFLSIHSSVCSGGAPDDGDWCIVVCENGLCSCEDVACEEPGGGGGGQYPVGVQKAPEDEAPLASLTREQKLQRFKTMTQAEARVACATTPGCMMSVGDEVVMRTSPTWGQLKIRYR